MKERIRFVLMDIEGTTSSIDFVHETLFPYSKSHLETFLCEHGEDERLNQILLKVRETMAAENIEGSEAEVLKKWIDVDRKHPALKEVQGMIWKKGFESGDIKGHFYKEVPEYLHKWKSLGLKLGIYSSGSVLAQKLLFKYSLFGDLSKYIDEHFDTKVGHKKEKGSYRQILSTLASLFPKDDPLKASEVLFLSDIEEELCAANASSIQTCLLVRDGSAIGEGEFTVAANFIDVSEKFNILK